MIYKKTYQIEGKIITKNEIINLVNSILLKLSNGKELELTIVVDFVDHSSLEDNKIDLFNHIYFEKKKLKQIEIKVYCNHFKDYVNEDLGYTKEQVLHATLHLDEKTLHIHCVVVPLIKKIDKRSNTERYTISKKQYIKDKYYKRLTEKGFDLERGIKGSDNQNINIKELKKITRKLNLDLNNKTQKLSDSVKDLQEKMQSNKNVLFDKEYVKIKKDTFDSMNKVIDDATNVMNLQPKLEKVYKEVNNYTKSYKSLKRENDLYKNEIENLQINNDELYEKNNELNN